MREDGQDNSQADASGTAPGTPSAPARAGDLQTDDAAAQVAAATAIDEHPLREMLKIAAPVVVAMASYTVMQFVDKMMVSRIGPDPIYVGAQGNAGLAAWVPISMVVGCMSVINTYVSQNLGNKTPDRAPAYAWAGVWLGVAAWALLIPYAICMPYLFRAMNHSPEQVEMEVGHGRILVLGAILLIGARAFSQFFYGLHRPSVVLVAEVTANLTNFVLNSVLIYGPQAPSPSGNGFLDAWYAGAASVAQTFGVPRLGVPGAAIGTVCATGVELAITMGVFLSPKYNRLYRTRAPWRLSIKHIKDIFRIGWPGGVMFGNEMICWGIFMVALVGSFGPYHSNAGWIAHQWMSLSFMPAVGISMAITAVVGKCIGARRLDLAERRAWLGVAVSAAYMGMMGVLFVVFREPMVKLFVDGATAPEQRDEIIRMGTRFLIAAATFQLFDGIAMSLSGALRGAGDTVWVGVVTMILAWTVIVGGGVALVRFAPGLGSLGPWMAASAYIISLSVIAVLRFTSGKWKTVKLLDHHPVAAH